jgi:hypothetical protein
MSNYEFSNLARDPLNTFINKYSKFIKGVFNNVQINIQEEVNELEYKQIMNFIDLIFQGVNGIKATDRKFVYPDFSEDSLQLGVYLKKNELFNKNDTRYIENAGFHILERMERMGKITKL